MRQLTSALVVGIALMQAGCIPEYLRPFKDRRGPVPTGDAPPKEALVKYLNTNAGLIQSVRSNDISLTYYGLIPVGLTAKMVCEKPRNLRLAAYHGVGSTEVDLGSNKDEFWWWIKRGDPYQYYCSYKDFEEGRVRAVMFPFQPEWIMEAMGMGNYGTPDLYEPTKVDPRDGKVRLVRRTRSPQGREIYKVIVFNRTQTDVSRGVAQVEQHQLIDAATGNLLVSAQISSVQVDPGQGGVLPRVMTLSWPAAKMKLSMTFDRLVVNAPITERGVFARNQINNIPPVDLARVPSPNGSLQRVQGLNP